MPTTDFVSTADWILGEILSNMPEGNKGTANRAKYQVADWPSSGQRASTGTPEDWLLLGMYEYDPVHRVTIFEQQIRQFAAKQGMPVKDGISDTLRHEIYQHVLGLDHVRETKELGLNPGYAVPCG